MPRAELMVAPRPIHDFASATQHALIEHACSSAVATCQRTLRNRRGHGVDGRTGRVLLRHLLRTTRMNLMRPWTVLLCLALTTPAVYAASAELPPSAATTATPPVPSDVPLLAPVVVSGVVPGPGLWRVSKGDHVLWVLGTLSPLPGHIQWESREVAQVLAQSKQVLLEPKIKLKADVGFFGKLFLL